MYRASISSSPSTYLWVKGSSIFLIFIWISLVECQKSTTITNQQVVERECVQIGNIIRSKGFSYPWWSNTQQQQSSTTAVEAGVCPGGEKSTKCCPSMNTDIMKKEMLEHFSQKWVGPKLTLASEMFKDRKSRFDVTFRSLLTRAHASFHAMFERTYGMLYIQHAHVFHALFTTLENYYENGKEALEVKLNEFFSILTRKMFQVLNSQYDFDETYLSCAAIVITEKSGTELHRQIVSSLRRSFVATRALAQGLVEGEKVIMNMQKLDMSSGECLNQISLMLHCPICAEQKAFKPCPNLCKSVTTKCLSPVMSLVKPWSDFTASLEGIIDRLLGPYNVEAVVEPIHIKISEAIMNFQESGPELSQAVFTKCGKPKLKSRGMSKRDATSLIDIDLDESPSKILDNRNVKNTRKRAPQKSNRNNPSGIGGKKPNARGRGGNSDGGDDSVQPSKSLEKLLRETKNRVKKGKTLWESFYKKVCNAIGKDYSSRQCWDGTSSVKVDKNNKTDETEEQSRVAYSRGTPTPIVAEQILILQHITDKLRAAYNGLDVTWVKESVDDLELGSGDGSGSGDFPTDLEDDDDDDPSGRIRPQWKPKPSPPHFELPPSTTTTTRITTSTSVRPSFTRRPPSGTPPPIFKPLPHDEDSRENTINFGNVPSGNNNNNRGTTGGIDFGPFVPPPQTPPQYIPPQYVPPTRYPPPTFYTTTPRTTTSTTTTRRPTTTRKSYDINTVRTTKIKTNSAESLSETGKTVAVFKLFAPVVASLIGKLFSFSN